MTGLKKGFGGGGGRIFLQKSHQFSGRQIFIKGAAMKPDPQIFLFKGHQQEIMASSWGISDWTQLNLIKFNRKIEFDFRI